MLYYRLFSYLIIFIEAFLLSVLFWRIDLIYWIIAISGLFGFIGPWLLTQPKVKSRKDRLLYGTMGALLILSAGFFYIFLESLPIKIILLLMALGFYWFQVNELFNQYFKRSIVQLDKLWNFYRAARIFIVLNIGSGLFALVVFLGTAKWLLALIFFAVLFFLGWYHNYDSWEIRLRPVYLSLISAWIMTQLFLVLSYFPLVYYIRGIILTTFYFFMVEAVNWYYTREKPQKFIYWYLAFALATISLLLLTASWA